MGNPPVRTSRFENRKLDPQISTVAVAAKAQLSQLEGPPMGPVYPMGTYVSLRRALCR